MKRFGDKAQIAARVIQYCREQGDLDDVIEICRPIASNAQERAATTPETDGFVYLMKSGKHYKIGFTNSLDRRQYELGPKLPLGVNLIHSIKTDDPTGIEAYWHRRFKDKHMNGEWFDLTPQEVAAL